MQAAIVSLYRDTFGKLPSAATRLVSDGSQRTYYRLAGDSPASVIGAHGPDPDENRAFLSFSRAFHELGLPVPEIYADQEGLGIWLEEDLGDMTLFRAITMARDAGAGPFPPVLVEAYERVIDLVPRFQVEGGRTIDFRVAYPRAAFDRQSMLWDLNYFKYHFLKLAHIPFNEQRLENDFERLIEHLLAADAGYFLYRDLQSRNILLRGGEPWFIDYQGGRRGPAQYDVASLLYDAKADIPEDVRSRLLERYLTALARHAGVEPPRFLETWRGHVLIRIMQAMGAYGYRGFFERKPRFLESVPYAARNVAGLLEDGLPVELPELEEVFARIVDAWAGPRRPLEPLPGLAVHIASFSYRDGPPADASGHGGGFVFDCRSLPNPGRLEEFAGVTGRDPRVARFLEAAPETEPFWEHARALVDAHIANFLARRFSDLSVAFGCTGGQHRSVYFAERLARHVRASHRGVVVRVLHAAEPRWDAGAAETASDGAPPAAAEPSLAAPDEQPWTE